MRFWDWWSQHLCPRVRDSGEVFYRVSWVRGGIKGCWEWGLAIGGMNPYHFGRRRLDWSQWVWVDGEAEK